MSQCTGCEWDPVKNLENHDKHEIWFEDACCVFDDPFPTIEFDDRDYDEDRWIITGRVESVVLVVVFTERLGGERLISARKALPHEERKYYAKFRRQRSP